MNRIYTRTGDKGMTAIHRYTAAEEIYDRANVKSDFVGPTTGKILLRRKRQCHQNPDMDNSYHKSASDGNAERSETQMKYFRTGNNGQNHCRRTWDTTKVCVEGFWNMQILQNLSRCPAAG